MLAANELRRAVARPVLDHDGSASPSTRSSAASSERKHARSSSGWRKLTTIAESSTPPGQRTRRTRREARRPRRPAAAPGHRAPMARARAPRGRRWPSRGRRRRSRLRTAGRGRRRSGRPRRRPTQQAEAVGEPNRAQELAHALVGELEGFAWPSSRGPPRLWKCSPRTAPRARVVVLDERVGMPSSAHSSRR